MKQKHPIFAKIETYDSENEFKEWLDSVTTFIGMVIMESTALEDELELLLYDWLSNDSNGKDLPVILETMNFYSKIEAVSKIAKRKLSETPECALRDGEVSLMDEWNELRDKLESSRRSRNEVAHGSWLYASKKDGVKVGIKRRGGDDQVVVYRNFDVKALKDILNNVTWARSILSHFQRRIDVNKAVHQTP